MSLPLVILSKAKNVTLIVRPGLIRLAHKGYWNKDWMPTIDPPKNEEESKAAAKKYGLIRGDYKPEPEDGLGHGDHPDLPVVSAEERNPYEAFDYPEYKRNYGEPLNVNADMYGEDKRNMSRQKFSYSQKLGFFFGIMGVMAFMCFVPDYFAKLLFVKQMAKQYPSDGVTYYTFEKKEK